MTKFLKNVDVTGYISQTSVTSSLVKTDANGKIVAATAGTDYQAPTTALLPIGGAAGQILSKIDATNYNTQWIDNFAAQLKHEVKLGATLAKGKAVYVSSADGTNMIVSAASNASEATSSKTLGLLETGGVTNDKVKVITEGLLAGLDTSTATAGDPVWLGTGGDLLFGLANKPVAPAHMVFIGIVTRVQSNNGEIFVKVQNGFELNEIHDVSISSLANNQTLVWESATSLWKNKTIAAALGYTPADDTTVVKLTGDQTVAGVKTFTSVVNAPSLSLNGGVLDGNNIVSMRSNPTGGQFRIEKSDGSLSAYPFYIGADGTALAYYYNAAGALKVLLHTDGTSYFGNNLSVGYTTYAATTYKLDVNGTARVVGPVLANAPSEGATGEGLIAGQSFKIDATATGQRAAMYVVSNVLSDTYASGLQAQYANFAGDKGFGFNLNTAGGFELYVKNTSWNKALTIANTKAATFTDTVTATSFIKTGGTSAQFLKADGSVDSSTYLTSSSLGAYLPLTGGTLTGALNGTSAVFSSTVQIGNNQVILTPSYTGYSAVYKVLAIGTGASNTNVSINYDPSGNAGGEFNGTGQIFIAHNKGILAPNAANNNYIAVLRPVGTGVYFGGGMASGELAGNGLFVSTGGKVGINTASPSKSLHVYTADNEGIYLQGTSGGVWMNIQSVAGNLWSIGAQNDGMGIYNRTSSLYAFFIKDNRQLQLAGYTASSSYTGTAAGYLAFDSSGNVITVAGVAATDDTKLPLAGGALTGPLSIAGTGTYLGDWGYNTLTLTDTGGYPGIFFKNGSNIWIMRRNGDDNAMDWAYSTNASAQGTGTFTQKMRLATDEWWVSTYPNYKMRIIGGDVLESLNGTSATTLYLQYHSNTGGAVNISAGKYIFNSNGNLSITGGLTFTSPGGSVLLKHAVTEVDAWIFQENAANWGLYWKNAPTGNHTFGGYTSVGAELFGMSAANASGNGVLTSNFVGATSAYAQWMMSNYTGYIWSASTIYAAGDMRSPIFRFTNSSNNAYLTGNSDWGFRAVNDSGYIQFGPANGSWTHIYSDKSFYFNQELYVNAVQVVKNSGTWEINITGSASSATTSTFVASPDGDRVAGNKLPTSNPRTVRFDFATAGSVTGATGNYAGVMTYAPWDGTSASTGDSSYQLAFINESGVNASGVPGLRLRHGINSTWNGWTSIITSSNISSQSVSNAATAGGLAVHTGRNNVANQIVRTDGSGYIQAGWINSDSGNMGFANRIARIQCSDDNYIRFQTLEEFKVSIGLSGKNNYSRRVDYTSDANYHVGSFGHGGTDIGNPDRIFHYGSGFFDVWSGAGTYPPSTSHIHGFNVLHYTTGFGGNAYGWQMASQYNQTGLIYARWVNGGTFSSWQTIITSANIGSQSVSNATTTSQREFNYLRVNSNNNLYLDHNYGCSVVGVYASTRFQGVFSMGDAYKLAIDGTSPGNLYGLSWSHPNAGGQAGYLNDHGLMVMVNGVTYSALSSNIWARGRVTANENVYSNGGWFYSYNNAGWYNETYGQGIRPAKANLTYGTVVNIGENFNGYGGYGITNTYNTLFMQNSGGDHGFFRDGGGGGWSFFYHQNYNCAGIGTDATDPSYSLHIIKYGGSNTGWIIWSDRRIKENIKTIDNALDKVLALRGVYYNKIDDPNKERCVGYIAQEVMEVVPELVVYSEELDMYNMNYAPMVGMLTEAMKEQQAQIEELKQQVQTLLNS